LNDKGLNLKYEKPNVNIILNDEKLFVDINFEIEINYQNQKTKISEFQYSLKRKNFFNINGSLKKNEIIISEDNNFYINSKKDTIFSDNDNNPVKNVLIKLREKNFDNLKNNVVVSNVVYEVLPNNIYLDNAVEIGIKLRKDDLKNRNAKNFKIAWYDKKSDLWRTYENLKVEEDNEFYYYKALVDHFTPIAVVSCSDDKKENNQIKIVMENIYRHPVDPVYKNFWVNFDKNNEKLYLLPELMQNATCNYPDETKKYNAIDGTTNNDCKDLIKDWDEDDNEKTFSSNMEVKDNKGNTISDNNKKTSCYNLCVEQVKKDLLCYYNNQCEGSTEGIDVFTDDEGFWFNPFEYRINKNEESEKISLISGDGIKDNSVLICEFDDKNQASKCIINDDLNNLKTIEKIDTTKLKKFPELKKQKQGIYATIMTYGYEKPKDVSGIGYFEFEIKDNGNSCIEEILKSDALLSGENSDKAKKFESEKIIFENDAFLCSSNAKCTFYLNNPEKLNLFNLDEKNFENSKLKSGLNYVIAEVENEKDSQAIAQGYLIIKGTGVNVKQEKSSLKKNPSDGSSSTSSSGSGAAGGGESYSYTGSFGEIFPGITLENLQDFGSVYFLVKIDLEKANSEFLVTKKIAPNVMTTSQFSAENKANIAINGGGFDIGATNEVSGFSVYQGERYSNNNEKDGATICFSKDNKVAIGAEECNKLNEIYYALTGFQRVLENSQIHERYTNKNHPEHKEGYDIKDPRTSFGIKKDETGNVKEINIIVVDGRSSISQGVNMAELAELHKKHGSTDAVNLDGGGSTTLVINKGNPEVVNVPSDGNERAVANHLGIIVKEQQTN
ncbi:MAG: phosphodiester glycosidase family protein, partial [Candidatus Woesearchaeota archaeon]